MSTLIRKYASGTPKPFSVATKKTVALEKDAADIVTKCGDAKASAEKVGDAYVVRYRKWFDTLADAKQFVAEVKAKTKKPETKKVEAGAKTPSLLKTDLQTMVKLMSDRGHKDLAAKTQKVLSKI